VSVAKSSMLMASGTIISRVLGFVRAVMIAAAIGVTTNAADAFGVANQLPNNVYAIIVGGVLNAVLVPQIVKARAHKDGGKGYIDRLLTFILTIFFAVSVVSTIAAPVLVSIYTQGWTGPQLALATAFAYWCLPQLFFYGLYSLLGEVLNARSAFGPFMWAPVLNNVVGLAGLAAFIVIFGADPTGSHSVESWSADKIALLAGSATVGVASQAFILLFAWKRIGLKLNLNFKWRGFGLGPALKAASWSLGMVVVTQIGGLVQTVVASGTLVSRETNSSIAGVAAAGIAWLIFMLPHSVATVSIATAYFTKMAHHVHDGKMESFKKDFIDGIRAILVISVFATAALIVMAYPISRVFAGEFPALVALGNVIIAMMLGLIPFSFVFMMQRAFFALEDTRSPFIFTVVQIGLHITGAITLSIYAPAEWLVVGLALLTSGTVAIQATVAYLFLIRRIGSLSGHGFRLAGLKFVLSGAVSGIAGFGMLEALGGIHAGSFVVDKVITAGLSMALIGFVMFAVYVVALKTARSAEIDAVLSGLKGIVRR
jgi:putative peptidoglycan lipid II flippase